MGLFDEYLRGSARGLYGAHFADPADRRRAVEHAARPLAPEVAASIEALNRRLPPSRRRDESVAALKAGAAAVVTGQQVGLFLGPLYTVHKAASAVAGAKALAQETGRRVIPVFWLQTEDHDLPEIASAHVARARGAPLRLQVPIPKENRVAVEHCALPPEVIGCVEALREELAGLPHAEEHVALIERHYRAGARWADAFAGVLAELFADDGLIFINPREESLARLAAPIHRRAIEDAERIAAALLERVRRLEAAGFQAQIHVRENAPLSFFHPDAEDGPRFRLERQGDDFALVGEDRVLRGAQVLRALQEQPRRFSTSALLRPILQDTLLPTAAYVGGPSEVAYFAQLGPLYEAFGMRMPLVVPRSRFRIIEERVERTLRRLGITADQAALDEDALLAGVSTGDRASPQRIEEELAQHFERAVKEAARQLEGLGLERSVQKTLRTSAFAAHKLREKYEKALLHRDRALVEDVRRIKAMLQPEGMPQERFYGISYFAARYGGRGFVRKLVDSVDPLNPALKDVRP